MFYELLVVPRWSPVHKKTILHLDILGQEEVNLDPVIGAVYRLLLKPLVHLVLFSLVVQSLNDATEVIVRFLKHPLVREEFQRNVEELVCRVARSLGLVFIGHELVHSSVNYSLEGLNVMCVTQ